MLIFGSVSLSGETFVIRNVPVKPPEGGLDRASYIKCEDIRSVSKDRLIKRLGVVSPPTVAEVEDRLRILLEL